MTHELAYKNYEISLLILWFIIYFVLLRQYRLNLWYRYQVWPSLLCENNDADSAILTDSMRHHVPMKFCFKHCRVWNQWIVIYWCFSITFNKLNLIVLIQHADRFYLSLSLLFMELMLHWWRCLSIVFRLLSYDCQHLYAKFCLYYSWSSLAYSIFEAAWCDTLLYHVCSNHSYSAIFADLVNH